MRRIFLLLVGAAALVTPALRADNLYGVLDCVDRVTVVDSVFLKMTGRQEIPVYTIGFRGDPGERDTFDFGAVRWPDERIRVAYLYDLTRMPALTITAPEQHTWYGLPLPAPGLAESRVMFYVASGIQDEPRPGAGALPLAAAPNPVTARATARFSLPAGTRVRVRLFDRDGRPVRTLCDAELAAGEHSLAWDRRDDGGTPVAAGVYLLRLESGAGGGGVKLVVRD